MFKKLIKSLIPCAMISSCTFSNKQTLPFELREVSGITAINDRLIAMVQDEEAIIYLYDIEKQEVVDEFGFNADGDYEDIELYNDVFYVLKSNGAIDKVSLEGELLAEVSSPHLSLENDTEGLCYCQKYDYLLVLCKEKPGVGLDKHTKAIYSFDMKTNTYSESPIITIDRSEFLEKKKRKKFKPSGLIVNENNELLLIDSKSSYVALFTLEGEFINKGKLDFPQPEGICIMPNADIWVASEGLKNGFLAKLNLDW